MKQYFRYLGHNFVPSGGIVEATGMRRANPRTGWASVQVRYPINGRFVYRWVDPDELIACDPPETWLSEEQSSGEANSMSESKKLADEQIAAIPSAVQVILIQPSGVIVMRLSVYASWPSHTRRRCVPWTNA